MKVIDFIFAARPMLMLPVWSIYLVCLKATGDNSQSFNIQLLILPAGITLIFAGAYYINQLYDYDTDLINKKLGFLQRGMIKKSEMTAAYISVSLIGMASPFYRDYKIGIIYVVLFILGWIYSAPPFRLKDRPIGGLLSNALAYGFFLALAVPGYLNELYELKMYLPIYFFLTVSAAYLLTTIPDREGDIKSGKKTPAAYLSDRALIFIGIILLAMSLIVSYISRHYYLIGISSISIILFLIALISGKMNIILFACKFPILLMSLLAGYYYPTYFTFLIVLIITTRLYYRKRFGISYPRFG